MTLLADFTDALARYEAVIGLETHVELGTTSKMFCGCATGFGAPPNTQVCPTCLGLPGSLPVINENAILFTVRIGLALHCSIADWCRFARKNYFYPDMPKDFQISQYDEPLCVGGYLDVQVGGQTHRVGITRVHLEEDTGKSLHVGGAAGRIHGATHSLVDYNRAGIPLVEIVTEPDIRSPEVAAGLRRRAARAGGRARGLRRPDGAGVAALRRERVAAPARRGRLRRPQRDEEPQLAAVGGTRHHATRSAGRPRCWTRGSASCKRPATTTRAPERRPAGRTKEESTDYRYFPEPDLAPLALSADYVAAVRFDLPELPAQRRARMAEKFGFSPLELGADAQRRRPRPGRGDDRCRAPRRPRRGRGGSTTSRGAPRRPASEPAELAITGPQLARVIALVADGTLTSALARQVVDAVLAGRGVPGRGRGRARARRRA